MCAGVCMFVFIFLVIGYAHSDVLDFEHTSMNSVHLACFLTINCYACILSNHNIYSCVHNSCLLSMCEDVRFIDP